jgi:DNA repair protein RecO (recombination protein O)
VRARESDVGDLVVRGQTLLDLGQNVFSDTRSMTESRDLMRALIATKLHGQPLHTRHVLMELQDL